MSIYHENRAAFQARLQSFPVRAARQIDFAYDLAKEAHRTKTRDSGEREGTYLLGEIKKVVAHLH